MKSIKKYEIGLVLLIVFGLLPGVALAVPIPPDDDPWIGYATSFEVWWGVKVAGTYLDTRTYGGGTTEAVGLPNIVAGLLLWHLVIVYDLQYPSSSSYTNNKVTVKINSIIGIFALRLLYMEGGYEQYTPQAGMRTYSFDANTKISGIQFEGILPIAPPSLIVDYIYVSYDS